MIAAMAAALTGGAASADEGAFGLELSARQGNMAYRALQLGVLGAMAKGEAAYDAEAAQRAADNLLAAATMDASMLWPQGSDSDALPDESEALPAIWAEGSDIGAKVQAMTDAASAMQAAAGTGLEPLQAAMNAVGGACGGCHKAFRKPAS